MEVAVISCSGGSSNTVSVWNPFNGTLISSYHGGGFCNRHGLVAKGGFIIANQNSKPLLHAWPLNKQHIINKRFVAPGKISALDMSPDCNYIALAVHEKLYVYQTASGTMCGVSSHHFQPILVVKFNSSSSLVCCGGEDGLISVHHLCLLVQKDKPNTPYFSIHSHSLPISDLFFTGGDLNSRIVSCSLDLTCKVYCLASKKLLYNGVFDCPLTALSLSPLESCFYIGDDSGKVHEVSFLNPPRGVDNHYTTKGREDNGETFSVHSKAITSMSCSLNSFLLITGSLDETVKVTHLKSRQVLQSMSIKGPVNNSFFYIPPYNMLSDSFRPSFHLHDFINNPENIEFASFNLNCSEDIIPDFMKFTEDTIDKTSQADAGMASEIDRLKKINNELFNFASNQILKDAHKHLAVSEETDKPITLNSKRPRK